MHEAVVKATLLYGVETWVLRAADMQRFALFDRGRVRWVAGVRAGCWAGRGRSSGRG